MIIEKFLRVPIKMEQLIQIHEKEIDLYCLYTMPDVRKIGEDTVFYLDDFIETNSDFNEIYPSFAQKCGLSYFFNGAIVSDIISNTKYQFREKMPSISDYIQNFNCYNEKDSFFDFDNFAK